MKYIGRFILYHQDLSVFILITIITAIPYIFSIKAPFIFDDLTVINNIKNYSTVNFSLIDFYNSNRSRVIPSFTFLLNYKWGGLNTTGYHLVNISIHILVAFMLYLFLTNLIALMRNNKKIQKYNSLISVFAAIFFASHPLQSQTVIYITQRMTSLSTLFYLMALTGFIKLLLLIKTQKFNFLIYLYSLLIFIFAIMSFHSKENSFTLPISFLLIILLTVKTFNSFLKNLIIPVILTLLALMLFSRSVNVIKTTKNLIFNPPIGTNRKVFTRQQYFLTQINVLRTYLKLILIPSPLILDYDYPISDKINDLPTVLSSLTHLGLLLLAIYLFKKRPLVSFGILFFYLTMIIESSIIPLDDVIFEHRLYLPMVGISIVMSYLIINIGLRIHAYLYKNKYITKNLLHSFYPCLMIIIMIYVTMTVKRSKLWASDVTLWKDNLIYAPNKLRVLLNLGVAYQNRGDFIRAQYYYKQALNVNPDYTAALSNLGFIYLHQNRLPEAELMLLKAVSLEPDLGDDTNLGIIYTEQGRFNDALALYKNILQTKPKNPVVLYNMGKVYEKQGNLTTAGYFYQEALLNSSKDKNLMDYILNAIQSISSSNIPS